MFHPRILSHYTFLVVDCQSCAVDACADTAHSFGVHTYVLADFLRAIGAVKSHRLNVL